MYIYIMVNYVHTFVPTLVTIIFFFLESILHYNIGKTGYITLKHFPSKMETFNLLITIVVFAISSTLTTNYIKHLLNVE